MSPANFQALLDAFHQNFTHFGELGASLSIWQNGQEIISEAHGWREKSHTTPWDTQTLIPIYSATKPLAAATLLLTLDQRGLSPSTPIREVWPTFPQPHATFAQLLSHQLGLPALDTPAPINDHPACVHAIEQQTPAWPPTTAHGYHPRTLGPLLEEPIRRLTGKTLGQIFHDQIATPLQLDAFIGLPPSQFSRVATLYPGKADQNDFSHGFYQQMQQATSLVRRAFFSPRGFHAVHEMNTPQAWTAALPAMGGIATASALAKFYQAAIGAIPSPLTPNVQTWLATPLTPLTTQENDLILLRPTVFSAGCQLDPLLPNGQKQRHLYGSSPRAFGHPGAGGSHAFADPHHQISFAYTMNQMTLNVFPGPKSTRLIDALYQNT